MLHVSEPQLPRRQNGGSRHLCRVAEETRRAYKVPSTQGARVNSGCATRERNKEICLPLPVRNGGAMAPSWGAERLGWQLLRLPQLRERRARGKLRLPQLARQGKNSVPQAAETFGNDSCWGALSTLKLILSRTIKCEVLPSIQKLGMPPECSKPPKSWNSQRQGSATLLGGR